MQVVPQPLENRGSDWARSCCAGDGIYRHTEGRTQITGLPRAANTGLREMKGAKTAIGQQDARRAVGRRLSLSRRRRIPVQWLAPPCPSRGAAPSRQSAQIDYFKNLKWQMSEANLDCGTIVLPATHPTNCTSQQQTRTAPYLERRPWGCPRAAADVCDE